MYLWGFQISISQTLRNPQQSFQLSSAQQQHLLPDQKYSKEVTNASGNCQTVCRGQPRKDPSTHAFPSHPLCFSLAHGSPRVFPFSTVGTSTQGITERGQRLAVQNKTQDAAKQKRLRLTFGKNCCQAQEQRRQQMPHIANPGSTHPTVRAALRAVSHTWQSKSKPVSWTGYICRKGHLESAKGISFADKT